MFEAPVSYVLQAWRVNTSFLQSPSETAVDAADLKVVNTDTEYPLPYHDSKRLIDPIP
jgi:hypothetical protein